MNKSGFVNVGDKVCLKRFGRWTVDAIDGGYIYLSRKVRGAWEFWKVLETRTFA